MSDKGQVQRASVTPILCRPQNIRRALSQSFPYALMFVIDDATLTIIACFHGSRDPAHWQKRS
jgi:hypothetical protein